MTNSTPWSRLLAVIGVLVLIITGLGPASLLPAPAVAAGPALAAQSGTEVIVMLEDGVDPVAAARDLGVKPTQIYRYVFTGFAGILPAGTTAAARRSSLVAGISPDADISAQAQKTATGFKRIAAKDAWPAAKPKRIDVDVAVLDSGVARFQNSNQQKGKPRSRDLNVRNGTTCAGKGSPTTDNYGHGTEVAGVIAAKNNQYGAVGVAPGARIWAVRVLNNRGSGKISNVICGLDWVFKNRNTIDLVNMSLGGTTSNTTSTCADPTPFHHAVCRVVNTAGIPIVVAAGNYSEDASTWVPARFDEVITVGSMADSDGKPGGLAGPCAGDTDDTAALFSNYGDAVDILAPGCRIRTTSNHGGTVVESGTSLSAPYVTGAAALFLAANPNASPAQVRSWLAETASVPLNDANGLIEPPLDFQPMPNATMLWLEGVTP